MPQVLLVVKSSCSVLNTSRSSCLGMICSVCARRTSSTRIEWFGASRIVGPRGSATLLEIIKRCAEPVEFGSAIRKKDWKLNVFCDPHESWRLVSSFVLWIFKAVLYAWVFEPPPRRGRPNGWTSTPRASRGATAKTTPGVFRN